MASGAFLFLLSAFFIFFYTVYSSGRKYWTGAAFSFLLGLPKSIVSVVALVIGKLASQTRETLGYDSGFSQVLRLANVPLFLCGFVADFEGFELGSYMGLVSPVTMTGQSGRGLFAKEQ